jgi:hypothetical protein
LINIIQKTLHFHFQSKKESLGNISDALNAYLKQAHGNDARATQGFGIKTFRDKYRPVNPLPAIDGVTAHLLTDDAAQGKDSFLPLSPRLLRFSCL